MTDSLQTIDQHVEETLAIKTIITSALRLGDSISLWRLPDTKEKTLIICSSGAAVLQDLTLEESAPGFYIAPFDLSRPHWFLKADQSFTFINGVLEDNSGLIQPHPESVVDRDKPRYHIQPPINNMPGETSTAFVNVVQKAIDAIGHGRFEKVVPSRSRMVPVPEDFEPLDFFHELCKRYPHAFVSLTSTPFAGTWIGASPELLAHVDRNQKFKTSAVAGTQRLAPEADPRNIAWTQKEIEEQAMVGRYIINCFKKIRLREFTEHGPKTCTAGNVIHLRTDFEVDMLATNFPQLGTVMTKLLHPTSAVCGMPMDEALAFIKANEGYDRQLYSGYLGPVNFKQETNLFVNLRCMQLQTNHAILYAGAGVTEDSIPEKEWEETEMKMNTLLEILQG